VGSTSQGPAKELPATMINLLRRKASPDQQDEQDQQDQHTFDDALAEEDISRILQVFKIGDLSDDRDLILSSENALIKPAACIDAMKEEWETSKRERYRRAFAHITRNGAT
jgi:hypothetical protein